MKPIFRQWLTLAVILSAVTGLWPALAHGSCGKEAVNNLTLSQIATNTSGPAVSLREKGNPWVPLSDEIPISHISQLTKARLISMTRCFSGGGGLRITAADGTEYLIGAPDASKNWPGVYTFKSAKGAFINLWYSTDEGGQESYLDFSFLNFYGTLEPLPSGTTYEYPHFKVTGGYLFTPVAGYNGVHIPRFMDSGHTYLIATEGYYYEDYQTTGWMVDASGLSQPMPYWAIIDITPPGYSVLAWINAYAFQYIIYAGALPYSPTYLDCQGAYNTTMRPNWNKIISMYGTADTHYCVPGWGGGPSQTFPNYLIVSPANPSAPVSIYNGMTNPPYFWNNAGKDGYDIDLSFLKDYIPSEKELKSIGMVGWAAKGQTALTLSGLANLTTGAPAQHEFWNQTLTLDKSQYQYYWDETNSRYIMGVEDGNDGDSNYNDVVLSLYVSPDVVQPSPQTVTITSDSTTQTPSGPAAAITLTALPADTKTTFTAASTGVMGNGNVYVWTIRNETTGVVLKTENTASANYPWTFANTTTGNITYTVSVYATGNDDYLPSTPATATITVSPPTSDEITFRVKSVPAPGYEVWFKESPETTIKVKVK